MNQQRRESTNYVWPLSLDSQHLQSGPSSIGPQQTSFCDDGCSSSFRPSSNIINSTQASYHHDVVSDVDNQPSSDEDGIDQPSGPTVVGATGIAALPIIVDPPRALRISSAFNKSKVLLPPIYILGQRNGPSGSSSELGSFNAYLDPKTTMTSVASPPPPRDYRFKMSIFGLLVASFLIVLDLTGISTALPTIVNDLHGTEFEWIGSAYALSSTAFLPFCGGLAQSFGRKPVVLGQVFLFGLGSLLCGLSTSMNFLIAARVVQGLGSGGIAASAQIIISDLVPLHERGLYNALIAVAYGLGSAVAPLIAGGLSEYNAWRWFFYLNLPICAVAASIIFFFLDVEVPKLSFKDKMAKLDWIGNILIISSTVCIVLALTWGGVKYPWSSAPVVAPLALGLLGLGVFLLYEFYVPEEPMLPWEIVASRTALSGYVQCFFGNFMQFASIYYLPLYFQACQGLTPIKSGVDVLSFSLLVLPFALATGISIAKTGRYRPQLWVAWCILLLGNGLYSTVDGSASLAKPIGIDVLLGAGNGILQAGPIFPILAPIPVELNAQALSFFMFLRFLSQTWGISIGGAIIQNRLESKLPSSLLSQLPTDTSIVYSLVQFIPTLPSTEAQLKQDIISDFAASMKTFWQLMIGLAGIGLVASLFMETLRLHTSVDTRYTLKTSKSFDDDRDGQIERNLTRVALEPLHARTS